MIAAARRWCMQMPIGLAAAAGFGHCPSSVPMWHWTADTGAE